MSYILKVKITQPQAQYRIPFSQRRQFTYPIPPYSTVKGLLCNLLGITSDSEENFKKIKEGLSVGIYGRYESIVREYVWYRNLNSENHKEKFHHVNNRIVDFTPQHPGGQIPVTMDVLHNVELLIYFYHRDKDFLEVVKEAFYNPSNRHSPIHLGRSEDWMVIEEVKLIPIENLEYKRVRSIDYFTWIPEKKFVEDEFIEKSNYDSFFKNLPGNIFRLPTFYKITSDNQRVFENFVIAKLYEGRSFLPFSCYVDKEENLPMILTKLGETNNE